MGNRRRALRERHADESTVLGYEMTQHLLEAHDLAEQVQQRNGSVTEELRRAQELVDELRGRIEHGSAQAEADLES
jgi:hypothetical protein